MGSPQPDPAARRKFSGLELLILALVAEKVVQHLFVTLAFARNWSGIRATVAVNPDVLLVLGAVVAVLFALSLWGLWNRRPWAVNLVAGLALFDLLGEFVAQGTLFITLNVSFLVAALLLVLALLERRRLRRGPASTSASSPS